MVPNHADTFYLVCNIFLCLYSYFWTFQVAQWVKNLPALQEKQKTQVEVSIPGLRRSPGRGMATIPVFLPGESHGQRSLVGYSPWCRKESDMTEVAEHT